MSQGRENYPEGDGRLLVPKIVWVTPVQVEAAKLLIELAERSGEPVPLAIQMIADAKRAPERAAS